MYGRVEVFGAVWRIFEVRCGGLKLGGGRPLGLSGGSRGWVEASGKESKEHIYSHSSITSWLDIYYSEDLLKSAWLI